MKEESDSVWNALAIILLILFDLSKKTVENLFH